MSAAHEAPALGRAWRASAVLGAALAAGACGNPPCGSSGFGCPDVTPHDGARDAADAASDVAMDAPARPIVGLAIDPTNPTLVVHDGAAAPLAFHALGMHADGTSEPVLNGTWSIDDTRLGTMAADGTFTANGLLAGSVQVLVAASGTSGTLTATTTVTVQLQFGVAPTTAPPGAFDGTPVTDPTRAVPVLYPLDRAVMPGNVAPPDVQWDQGNAGDVYRVRLARTGVTVDGFVTHSGADFTFDWPVDPGGWRALANNAPDEPVAIQIDRYDAAARQLVAGPPVHVTLAHGSVYGVVYHWQVWQDSGADFSQLIRIAADSADHDILVRWPPRAGAHRGQVEVGSCIGCHTVSHDGRYMASNTDFASATVIDLTTDLTAHPVLPVFAPGVINWMAGAFNPDSSRLLIAQETGDPSLYPTAEQFAMIDPHSGASVATTGLPPGQNGAPAWSPDGARIAYIAGGTDAPRDYDAGDLATFATGSAPDTFDPPQTLHHGADLASALEGGNVDAHPSWSPDSRWIAFQHGTHATAFQEVRSPSALYLLPADGGAPTRLETILASQAGEAYWPTFSPFYTAEPGGGGYYWMAFYSFRDYGNARAGTRGAQRRQLWVSAIRTPITPGEDPTSVPYWLPGQDVTKNNIAAFWVPSPCRSTGSTCETSAECCSGSCLPDGHGGATCQPPPPAQCRQRGQSCGGAGECCDGLSCIGNVCDMPPPG